MVRLALFALLFGLTLSSTSGCDLPTYLRQQERIKEEEAAAAQATANRESELVILHDSSLSKPFFELARAFEQANPAIRVRREAAGGRVAARQVAELGKTADILAVTDFRIIQNLLMPGHAEWFVCFARNEMVLAYTPHSKYRTDIHRDNWFEILARPDVSFGYPSPDLDPCGYRTRLVWKLTDLFYRKSGEGASVFEKLSAAVKPDNVRPSVQDLVPVLHGGALDYVFLYRSVAEQNNLQYVRLRDEINLGSPKLDHFYRRVSVEVAGGAPGAPPLTHVGGPIVYAFTIPVSATNRGTARAFADLLVGPVGASVMARDHQSVIPGGRIGFLQTTIPTLD